MGAKLWCTGPAHVFISKAGKLVGTTEIREQGSPLYLGTCEFSPAIRTFTVYEPVHSDTRGPRLPDDWLLGGEHAITRLDLTRWDEAVYARIAAKGTVADAQGTTARGTLAAKDIGAMVRRAKLTFILMVLFPYATTNFYRGMPKGYRFPKSVLEEEAFDPVGTQARKLGLVIHSIAETQGNGDLLLYDDDLETAALLPLTK